MIGSKVFICGNSSLSKVFIDKLYLCIRQMVRTQEKSISNGSAGHEQMRDLLNIWLSCSGLGLRVKCLEHGRRDFLGRRSVQS